jgi:light-regulated signal transduction histidine kinase (bacteriophytochrome)
MSSDTSHPVGSRTAGLMHDPAACTDQGAAPPAATGDAQQPRSADMIAELETVIHELEAFSYSVAHDLRAPLRSINGWSMALLEDYGAQLDKTAHGYLEQVRSETRRMGQMIDALLELSRITSFEIRHDPVDFSLLANKVALRLQQAYSGRRIDFSIQPGLTVRGDTQLLEIVLNNLFDNACKYTATRVIAQIEFGLSVAQDPQTKIFSPVFFVRDNGVGFSMAHAHKLFGAFQRMHKASEFPGTGIGLAMVRRILRRHGSKIWAEAQVELGATFYFSSREIS